MRAALDHPVVFLIFVTLGVFALAAVFRWGFKAMNVPGAANLFGG